MINYKKTVFFTLLMTAFLSPQAYALGESISKLAQDVGKSAGIGITATEIDQTADTAINKLLKTSPAAVNLSKNAKAVLIFPKIIKAGFGVGGHRGEGVLRKKGKSIAYYKTVAGSYGLQIGAQSFGYAMFFMDDKGLNNLIDHNSGWEVGVGPSVVVVDKGMAKTLNNTTATESVYVFTFNQNGLMAGAGIQGSKITKINPDK